MSADLPTLTLRCQRCGIPMDLRDPAPGAPWAALQYWVCAECGRHFWTTYPPPKPPAAANDAPAPADAAASPA